jgi:dTMP kinase
MFASRAQAAAQVIGPSLNAGAIVLTDRFTDASLAYQGYARGLGFETVRKLHGLVLDGLTPNLTLCIELDLEASIARAHRRNDLTNAGAETRFDEQSLAFHRLVREGYHQIAQEEAQRFFIVDGSGEPDQVEHRIWLLVEPLIRGMSAPQKATTDVMIDGR